MFKEEHLYFLKKQKNKRADVIEEIIISIEYFDTYNETYVED